MPVISIFADSCCRNLDIDKHILGLFPSSLWRDFRNSTS